MAQNQPFALRSVLESNKLNETNYADWIRNLRIVLRAANKEDVLDNPLPEKSTADTPTAERNAYMSADTSAHAFADRFLALGLPASPPATTVAGRHPRSRANRRARSGPARHARP